MKNLDKPNASLKSMYDKKLIPQKIIYAQILYQIRK